MVEIVNCYHDLAQIDETTTRTTATFDSLITPEPARLNHQAWAGFRQRHSALKAWQSTTLDLVRRSLLAESDPQIAQLFLGELPEHLGESHHVAMLDAGAGTPVFFRTDEVAPGKIAEVQCPGSLWGTHEHLRDYYDGQGHKVESISRGFVSSLRRHVGQEPVIHHLLDNASHPAGERYFIQRVRPHASYFGYDRGVHPSDCNFIRGHDFFSLMFENHTRARLEGLRKGDIFYDLPPCAIFDQKVGLALPFMALTRSEYTDEVRALFPDTYLVTPGGFVLADGEVVTLDAFCALPRARRSYYLKYAGTDVSCNWGSKAVFHLGRMSREACAARLSGAATDYVSGRPWIVQQAVGDKANVTYVDRDGTLKTLAAHSKTSGFYGPDGLLGILVMHESFHKVHGSTDTVITIGC